jgi:ectoine hydroxylase-related dioxygenase (phytanoyl-CoA dioxygenase family)
VTFTANRVILDDLKQKGFVVVENFLDRDACIELAQRLEVAIESNPSLVHPATAYDLRLHGIENVDTAFETFSEHPQLQEVARLYLDQPARVAFTLGASLRFVAGNPGSGGGWHRDSFSRQFKSMLYLSDVAPENGPFQIIEGSHRLLSTVRDNIYMDQRYGDSRLSHEKVSRLLAVTGEKRLHTLGGKAGTLVLFDSTAIHRGAPIKDGKRLALTNYFFPDADIGNDLYAHFLPVAGHAVQARASR